MGMTPVEFWEESPYLAVAYRKAYRLKRKVENEQAWLNGLYVYDAFAVVLSTAFSKRNAKKPSYLEKPIDIFPLTKEEKKAAELEEQKKMEEAMKAMIREQQAKKQRSKKKKQKGEDNGRHS